MGLTCEGSTLCPAYGFIIGPRYSGFCAEKLELMWLSHAYHRMYPFILILASLTHVIPKGLAPWLNAPEDSTKA